MSSFSVVRALEHGVQMRDIKEIMKSISHIKSKGVDPIVKDLSPDYALPLLELMINHLIDSNEYKDIMILRWIRSLVESNSGHLLHVKRENRSDPLMSLRTFLHSRSLLLKELTRVQGRVSYVNSTLEMDLSTSREGKRGSSNWYREGGKSDDSDDPPKKPKYN